ncbi:MAG: hypothetical protein WCD53_10955 [Microcoleus sp.]
MMVITFKMVASAKSGLNKSSLDAAFGQFFKTLEYIAEQAVAVVISQKPADTSTILSYRNKIIFTDSIAVLNLGVDFLNS